MVATILVLASLEGKPRGAALTYIGCLVEDSAQEVAPRLKESPIVADRNWPARHPIWIAALVRSFNVSFDVRQDSQADLPFPFLRIWCLVSFARK